MSLCELFAEAGFEVTGIDSDIEKVHSLNSSIKSKIPSSEKELQRLKTRVLKIQHDLAEGHKSNLFIIAVSTPMVQDEPNFESILDCARTISRFLSHGDTVVVESTIPPNFIEDSLVKILSGSKNLIVGTDYFLGASPERLDSSNKQYANDEIPKIISGVTASCVNRINQLYSRVFKDLRVASSTATASFVKHIENSYRLVNISFINEIAILASRAGVDIWECVSLASSKPYGFQSFFPSLGAGGHCIPNTPIQIANFAELSANLELEMVTTAAKINGKLIEYAVQKVVECLNKVGKELPGSSVIILGLAYKRHVADARESRSLFLAKALTEHGAKVSYYDPEVVNVPSDDFHLIRQENLHEISGNYDLIFISRAISSEIAEIIDCEDSLILEVEPLKWKKAQTYRLF